MFRLQTAGSTGLIGRRSSLSLDCYELQSTVSIQTKHWLTELFFPCSPLTQHLTSCHISTNPHSGTGCHQMHIKPAALCAQRPSLHVDWHMVTHPCQTFVCFSTLSHCSFPPWSPFCFFCPDYQASVFWQDTSHLAVYCSITIQIKTTAMLALLECKKKKRHSNTESCMCAYINSEQTWLTCFLSRNTFVRCLCQHPEATFSSWVPLLWPRLLCSSAFCSLAFGTLYPAYSSYKAVKTKNVKEYVSITSGY